MMGLQRVLPNLAHFQLAGRRDVPHGHCRRLVVSVVTGSSDGDGL